MEIYLFAHLLLFSWSSVSNCAKEGKSPKFHLHFPHFSSIINMLLSLIKFVMAMNYRRGELEKIKSNSWLDKRMVNNILKIEYNANISNSNNKKNNKKAQENNKIPIVIIQIVIKRWQWWINTKRNNCSSPADQSSVHLWLPRQSCQCVWRAGCSGWGMSLWLSQVPCPGYAVSCSLVHLHKQSMGNWGVCD